MFERFTPEAHRVLERAQVEASRLNDGFTGTDHLLLGLLLQDDGPAARALASLGVTLEGVAVLEKVEEMGGPSWSDPNGLPPFTRSAIRVMKLAEREAVQLGHDHTHHAVDCRESCFEQRHRFCVCPRIGHGTSNHLRVEVVEERADDRCRHRAERRRAGSRSSSSTRPSDQRHPWPHAFPGAKYVMAWIGSPNCHTARGRKRPPRSVCVATNP